MNKVTVKKEQLIETLEKNKAAHREQFEKAQKIFRERVIEELDRRLEMAKKGDKVELFIRLPEPEEHTEDYDRALQMLEWEVEDEVTLSESQFNELVLNNWGWLRSFHSNTVGYLVE